MHNILYISNADRIRLVELNDAIRACTTLEEQRAIREEIAELEAKRKPLHECDLNEITELRTFVWDKFDKLNRSGKYHLAVQFRQMLQQIELRQAAIHRDMSREEARRQQEKAQGKVEQTTKVEKLKQERSERTSTGQAKSRPTSSRWTTGIGSLD